MDIYERISDLGVTLVYSTHLPSYRLGAYYDDQKVIVIRANLTRATESEVLHHEYVHAKYRDRSCDKRCEDRAMREAACMMIDTRRYRSAERIDSNPHSIATELQVTVRTVEVYQGAIRSGHVNIDI